MDYHKATLTHKSFIHETESYKAELDPEKQGSVPIYLEIPGRKESPKTQKVSFVQVSLLLFCYKRMDSNQKLDSMTYKWDSYVN